MSNPEIGKEVSAGGIATNVHDQGEGFPVMLLHGSGPGVTAWANWRLSIPVLAQHSRVIAPDILGFGYTERPADGHYDMQRWQAHIIALADALELEQFDLVGNSFGGALALALAIHHPKRVRRLVLMGSVGLNFPLTPGLDAVWGYTPSVANMRRLLDIFAHDRSLVSDELAQLRYQASIRAGVQEAYAAMFPAPRQRWIEAMAQSEEAIAQISQPSLIIHGREDEVIPPECASRLFALIPDAQLHMFGQCGHWTQIEKREAFNTLVNGFLTRD